MIKKHKKQKEKWYKLYGQYDKSLKIHDFRMVVAKSHINVIFDVVVPFGKDREKEELVQVLAKAFAEETIPHYFVITVDRPFVEE